MKHFRLPRNQSGFSLLEVLLAVSVAIAVGSMQLTRIKDGTERIQAEAVGRQLQTAGQGLNSYILMQRNSLINGISVAGDGDVSDPGPRTCSAIVPSQGPGWQCTVTTQTLQRVGVLPLNFSGVNGFGSSYEYVIRVEGTAPDWRLEGMVRTAQPYLMGGQIRNDLIGQALNIAGSESGAVSNAAGTISGLNGLWVENNWSFGSAQEGMLAYRAGFGTGGFNEVLRVDGTNEFTDDLDMGTSLLYPHHILEINNITASNDIRGAQLIVNDPRLDAFTLGTSDPANQTVFGNDANRMRIMNQGGVQMLDGAGNPTEMTAGDLTVGSVTARGFGSFGGAVQAEGLSTAGGHNILSMGEITAIGDFYTETGDYMTQTGHFNTTNGNLSARGGTVSAGNLNIGGSASIADTVRFGTTGAGWFYDLGSNTMRLGGNTDLHLGVPGSGAPGRNLSGGRVISETYLAGQRLQIGASQAPGTSCGSNTFATDIEGRMMECVDGTYTLLGGVKSVVAVNSAIAFAGQQVSALCPAGRKMVGGGWLMTQRNTPATDPYAPSRSSPGPAGDRWIVENVATGHTAAFQAQVLCAN